MRKIREICEDVGIENVLVMIGMRPLHTELGLISYVSGDDEPIYVPCRITQERYKVSDNYKITLKPIYHEFETKHFYQSDLEQIIRDGHAEVFIRNTQIK